MSSGATKEEILPLNIVPGQGDKETTAESSKPSPVRKMISNLRNDRTHRVLAIMSIICGVSCIGIKALISSVKAGETTDIEAAKKLSKEAKKFGIISIVTLFAIFVCTFSLLALVSYLLTLDN
ncbi:Transmembrane protein 265 [Oryzias melastigma]|uniref:Transmembrane protein 265 n=1 Tax=Oryzias melastigma TaxID=30732 RepID=A0A834FM28_ORYME|nr:Transmembrane protein 265 [Oryzias melastigma]